MTNGVSGALLQEIERAFSAQYGLTTSARIEKSVATIPASSLDSLPGTYYVTRGRDTIKVAVSRRGDNLWLTTSNDVAQFRLLPQGPDSFFDLENGVTWRFERPSGNASGAPTKIVREFRGQRIEAMRAPTSSISTSSKGR
jgi:hypothetical protein